MKGEMKMDINQRIASLKEDNRLKELRVQEEQRNYNLVRFIEPGAALYHQQQISILKNRIRFNEMQIRRLEEELERKGI